MPPGPAHSRRPRRIVVWLVATSAIAGPFAVAILFATLASGFGNLFNFSQERKHLAPIPIAASACPYVVLMHHAANNFQASVPPLGVGYDARGRPLSWPQMRARLRVTLDALDVSIVGSKPHFPAPVRRQLELTLREIQSGRAQLPIASNGPDFFTRTLNELGQGVEAFGYASDLVGHRCGVPLGADDSSMPYPFGTTTSLGGTRNP